MPPKSEAQRRAMYAAAMGKSVLGIPKKVGEEYIATGKNGKTSSGTARKKAQSKKGKK